MQSFGLILLGAALGFGSVSAQIPQCATTCVTTALGASGCTSLADTRCFCTSQAFVDSALQCAQTQCTTDEDRDTAITLFNAQCAAFTTVALPTGPSTGASTSAAETSTASGESTTSGTATATASASTSTAPGSTVVIPSPRTSTTSSSSRGSSSSSSGAASPSASKASGAGKTATWSGVALAGLFLGGAILA